MLHIGMRHLLEIRAAYFVAKLGTVSAAAQHLGVHRATVQRRIDVLEKELGGKVFLRHSRGYSATELGQELLGAAERIEEEIDKFIGYSSFEITKVDGELIIATTPPSYTKTVIATVKAFQEKHKDASVKFLVVSEPPKLEVGEAHIYFHFGEKLDNPDYVELPWLTFFGGVYGTSEYFEQHGNPKTFDELQHHKFALLSEEQYSTPNEWLRSHIPEDAIAFTSNDRMTVWRAVQDGLALGCLNGHLSQTVPNIEPIKLEVPKFQTVCWVITHVDGHRSPKVQAYLQGMRKLGLMGNTEIEVDPSILPPA